MPGPGFDAVVDFLERGALGGLAERVDTHAAIVLLAGERAYKLKRPVRYSFLDFTALAAREAALRHELALNRRTAPELYVRVLPVTAGPGGELVLDGKGTPVEWLLEMRRFPADAQLDQINAIVNRLTDDVARPLLASDVAAELGMSESRFSRFFRRATGNTFTDFVNRVRINRACQLLMESERQITAICYEVGFNNVANFNRRFLEIKGMTPSEFRRQAESRFGGARA